MIKPGFCSPNMEENKISVCQYVFPTQKVQTTQLFKSKIPTFKHFSVTVKANLCHSEEWFSSVAQWYDHSLQQENFLILSTGTTMMDWSACASMTLKLISSPETKAHQVSLIRMPMVLCPSVVHHFPRSSLKRLGQLKPNFTGSLCRKGEGRYI